MYSCADQNGSELEMGIRTGSHAYVRVIHRHSGHSQSTGVSVCDDRNDGMGVADCVALVDGVTADEDAVAVVDIVALRDAVAVLDGELRSVIVDVGESDGDPVGVNAVL